MPAPAKRASATKRVGKKKALTLRLLDRRKDGRVDSLSILISMRGRDYLRFVKDAYERRGGLEGQREALKTSSAIRIRDRLAEDIKRGAIIPPLTVGLILKAKDIAAAAEWSQEQLATFLATTDVADISIIDGMQRTTVLRGIEDELSAYDVRVELWMAKKTSSLAYRMLILNTGQVPWNLRRQIEVIHSSLIKEISHAGKTWEIPPEIYNVDDKHRRTEPGQYQANEVIEMYVAFGLRKHQVDKETVLVDQFSRLDMIDAVSRDDYFENFAKAFEQLNRLDHVFSRWPGMPAKSADRFSTGRALFDSTPACVGFIAAAAQIVMGRPGMERKSKDQQSALKSMIESCTAVVDRLARASPSTIGEFLDFGTLNEVLNKQAGKIGEFERSLFTDAFRLLLTEGDSLTSMTPCWRSS
ncbi:MAG: hypothetical protein JNK64_11285 [Myxococcales bacterium]|nr:hypothetical protein [Myxococcales bacterium]